MIRTSTFQIICNPKFEKGNHYNSYLDTLTGYPSIRFDHNKFFSFLL